MLFSVEDGSQRIIENREGFFEGDSMLCQVFGRFGVIPLKFHGQSYSAHDSRVTIAALVNRATVFLSASTTSASAWQTLRPR